MLNYHRRFKIEGKVGVNSVQRKYSIDSLALVVNLKSIIPIRDLRRSWTALDLNILLQIIDQLFFDKVGLSTTIAILNESTFLTFRLWIDEHP